jgi:hypothetical protein
VFLSFNLKGVMAILSTFIVIYLSVGSILAGLVALSFYFAEKECPEHSTDRQNYDDMMSKVSLVAKNPKLFLLLNVILLWPKVLSQGINK